MDILKKYSAALELYRAKKFDAALKLVEEVQNAAPHWKKSFLLEIFIRRDMGEPFKEFSLLEKFLPRLDLNSANEKNLAADAFNCFGAVNRILVIGEPVRRQQKILRGDKQRAFRGQQL